MCRSCDGALADEKMPVSRFAWMGVPFRWLIIGYQHTLGHAMGGRCRFYPSCSHYGLQAFRVHAPWRAFWLTAYRIGRCHPWGGSGVDPVPPLRVSKKRSEG